MIDLGADRGARKARGAFFTPAPIARFIARWAIRSAADAVLEPSCGEAAMLVEAGRRLGELGASTPRLEGHDVHEPSIAAARRSLAADGLRARLAVRDFLASDARPRFDAVIGNPPYVRYQSFTGEARRRAQELALRHGVRLDGLANAWAAFVVHAAAFLRPGGRLALVLPAVLLTVNYAAPVRAFLLQRFASVRLVLFRERVFPGVEEEVVLLLAEGSGGTDQLELVELSNARDLERAGGMTAVARSLAGADKWTAALVPPAAAGAYEELSSSGAFTSLSSWGETDLGIVTGNNRYFTLTAAEVAALGLGTSELLPVSPPGSRHLRHLALTGSALRALEASGARCRLFYPAARPSAAAARYIAEGEARAVHDAYKCRIRSPWWRVPLVDVPDLFLTYMSADAPQLVANRARLHHLNSVHGVRLRDGLSKLGVDLLPMAALGSVTLLGTELVGRSYGGGVLKLEPREADRLSVASPDLLRASAGALRALRPTVASALRRRDIDAVARLVDDALLAGHPTVTRDALAEIRAARQQLRIRRASRGRPVFPAK